ncbi:uncharacterized protein SAPINGB_P002322 [Magnusiomyces paraingens]|uniref:Uncharacterized protein n=1 Tax=Magnusiomyces paraingens TaxID=2606893 RepID=A0A5E8BDB2_9ASCO|nr:uncharacterized protein SAPINGB_P002322 [Saprochaete ingens]VVT49545.1 unnamed protein product [Saprochaete ingens]
MLVICSFVMTPVLFFANFLDPSLSTLRVDFPQLNATSLSNIFTTDDNNLNQQLSSLFGSLTDYELQQYSGERLYSYLFCMAQVDVNRDEILYGCTPSYGFKVGYFIERLVPENFKEPMLAAYQSISTFNSIRSYGNLHMVMLWLVKLCFGIPMFLSVYILFHQSFYIFDSKKEDRKIYKYIIANAAFLGIGCITLFLTDITILGIINKNFTDWGFYASLTAWGNLIVWGTFVIAFLELWAQYKIVYGFEIYRAAVKFIRQKGKNGDYNGMGYVYINPNDLEIPDEFLSELQTKREEQQRIKRAKKEEKKAEAYARREEQLKVSIQLKAEREAERQAIKERQEEERQMKLEEEGRLKIIALEKKKEKKAERVCMRELAQAEKEAERIRLRELAQAAKQAQEEERMQRQQEWIFAKERARAEAVMKAEAKAMARAEKNKPVSTQDDMDNNSSSFGDIDEIQEYRESVAYPQSARTKFTGYPQSYEPSRRAR